MSGWSWSDHFDFKILCENIATCGSLMAVRAVDPVHLLSNQTGVGGYRL